MSNEQPETRDIETEAQDLDERSVKRPRTADDSIDPNGVPDGDQQDQAVAGVEGGEGEGGGAGAPEPTPQNAEPVKIGYKSFASGAACYEYFHNIISKYRKNQNLNEVGSLRLCVLAKMVPLSSFKQGFSSLSLLYF